ncbi:MAG: hypothetical protein QXE80_03550 [Pyrobaculum sp.]
MNQSQLEQLLKNSFKQFGIDASEYTDVYNYIIRPITLAYSQLYNQKSMLADFAASELSTPEGISKTLLAVLNVINKSVATGYVEIKYDLSKLENKQLLQIDDAYFQYKNAFYVLEPFLLSSDSDTATAKFSSLAPVAYSDIYDMPGQEVSLTTAYANIINHAKVISCVGPAPSSISADEIASMLHSLKITTPSLLGSYISKITGTDCVVVAYHELPNYHGVG